MEAAWCARSPDDRRRACSILIQNNSLNATAYINRGVAYADKHEYDRAITDYTKAIEIDPRDALAYFNRGNAYRDKGEYDRANADYTRAIEINPPGFRLRSQGRP